MPSEEVFYDPVRVELEKTRQQLNTLFEFNPNGVFIIGRDGCFTALNPACQRIMGYTREELVGRSFQDVTAPESLEVAQRGFLGALAGKTVLTRIIGYARDGSKRHLDMSIAPIVGDDGNSVLVMAHDVTQRVQAEAERDAIEASLRASEERYQAFISQSSEAIWRYELEEPIPVDLEPELMLDLFYKHAYLAECNDALANMYGYKQASELLGMRLSDTLTDTPENRDYLRAFINAGYRISDAESDEIDRYGNKRYFSNNLIGIIEDGMMMRAWGTQRDITERRSAEEAVRAAEERYQVFIAQSTEAIWRYELEVPIPLHITLDEQIDLVYERAYLAECNDVMARLYGFSHAHEVIGKRLSELLPRIPPNESYLRAFASNNWRLSDVETSRVEQDGVTRHYISNLLGIIEDGHVIRAWGTRRDLTERKEVENRLRESQERLDLALRAGDLGTWEWNLKTGSITCSALSRMMLGLDAGDESDIFVETGEIYKKLESAIHPADRAQVLEQCCRSAERHMPLEIEYRVVWPDNSVHWLAIEGRLVRVDKEQPTRMIGTCRDITRRKRREMHQAVIAEASQQLASTLDLDTLLNSMARLLVPAQADWCVLELLEDAAQSGTLLSDTMAGGKNAGGPLSNGAMEHPPGHRVAVAHAERYKEQFLWQMQSLASEQELPGFPIGEEAQPLLLSEITSAQMEMLWPDEAQRALIKSAGLHSMMCVPLYARGRPLGALIMALSDVERRFTEEDRALAQDLARRVALAVDNALLYGQAQLARREAETANRAKDEFLAVVSHELRTPLTPLLGWIDLINSGRLNVEQNARALESIGRNAHAQLQLVNDLLDVSRMISGKLPLSPMPLDWRGPVELAIESVATAAADKGVALIWEAPDEAVIVAGEAMRLRQVAMNLLTNAVKFTPAGGRIVVSLKDGISDATTPKPCARLEVSDSGIGIAAEFLPHVWDRFRQADATTTRNFGGLGLGLAIVRHIILAHDGESAVQSEGVGRGTMFRITLPLCSGVAEEETVPELPGERHPVKAAGSAVLLVDDEADARELFTAMLRDSGWDTRAVASCEEAFQLLEEGEWLPSVIISDVALPCMDGYEFMSLLTESRWKDIPVIALTAYARDEDRQRALKAGFVKHLTKPATEAMLHEAVLALVTK